MGHFIANYVSNDDIHSESHQLIASLSFVKEMEKLASRKLRISAKETMRIAEKLYTQG